MGDDLQVTDSLAVHNSRIRDVTKMVEVTFDKESKKLVGWESLFALLDDI